MNGIDYVEPGDDRTAVTIAFFGGAPRELAVENVRVDAPPRAAAVRVERVRLVPADDGGAGRARIVFDRAGDPTTYTLSLVEADKRGRPSRRALRGFDPRHASADFTFTAGCPSGLDCLDVDDCPPETYDEPTISYLAKDYASFRQLILDRLALIMPGWTERHVPDLELMLVEVLAYVGDYLSYYQDAVATEAYLGTARRRISVRRHARLVDYRLHEGCNARAWVTVWVAGDLILQPGDYRFLTGPPASEPRAALRPEDVKALPPGSYEVFEPVGTRPADLRKAHNSIGLWAWGEEECCIAAGATCATLQDSWADGGTDAAGDGAKSRPRTLHLSPGDVLVLEEVLGPRTGSPDDADPTHRQAVRLTAVTPGYDDVFEQPVVEIEWAGEDALCFPLCLSTTGPDCKPLHGVSVARGNVILVDHGSSIAWCGGHPEPVPVPPAPLGEVDCDPCAPPNARRLLEKLLASTAEGKELTNEQLALVAEVVGPAAALEAGFAPDADDVTDDAKAKAARERDGLEAFLADRGRFPVPYTAALQGTPVTHSVAFPTDESIAASQARYLGSLEQRVRAWVAGLLPKAEQGDDLAVHEYVALGALFGRATLRAVGLVGDDPTNDARTREGRIEALGRLLDRWPSLLDRKVERLRALARRARAGYVLGADVLEEIAETWGAQWAEDLDPTSPRLAGPACAAMEQDPREALAALTLTEGEDGTGWDVVPDLLDAEAVDRGVVVEVDDEGIAHLRFGDGVNSRAVDPGTTLVARYRVGNGAAGNVGAEAVSRIVLCETEQDEIRSVRNPLPACGGVDPESTAEAKLYAPLAFRYRLLRAVTAADYASAAGTVPGVQRAAAELSWTGSWYEADVALDPLGAEETSPALAEHVRERLHRYRRIGHDVRVAGADYVPIDVALRICVLTHYQRGQVKKAVLEVLGTRALPTGGRGFFHPDNLTFGGEIALSGIVAAVQAIAGVRSVEVVRFERFGEGDHGERGRGVLQLAPFEIARLDNDVRRPENGRLELELRGGR